MSAVLETRERLLPALDHLAGTIEQRAAELAGVVKIGRTHLMDAMPLTVGQELGGWARQVRAAVERVEATLPRLTELAQGGTAVGTGINAHPDFAVRFAGVISRRTGQTFVPATNRFAALSSQDTAVELSGQLRVLAVSLMKIANDLRWMNSGPLAGLAEVNMPALQPGSSIMPGKVNPVIPESVAMVCAQVIGNDVTVAVAGQSGSFQLNTMLPVIAYNLLQSIGLLSNVARVLADKAIAGFSVNRERIAAQLKHNPVLVTVLATRIGYEKAAAIARRAYADGRDIHDVAREMTGLPEEELALLLDPARLTGP
jgi:fumarate hydratase, class II